MTFPTRVRYGLRMLARLALRYPEKRISMLGIAAAENVSPKYLEQIVAMLKPLDILAASRGAGGGYTLTKNPEDITLESVFACLGGLKGLSPCVKNEAVCARTSACSTHVFWADFDAHLRGYLRAKTLRDLVTPVPGGGENTALPLQGL